MKHFYNNLKGLVVAMVCCLPFAMSAQTVNTAVTGQDLVNSILGSGVTATNVTLTAAPGSFGTFAGGNASNIGLDAGVLLTTGSANDAFGSNNSGGTTTNNGFAGDADLNALVGGGTLDATILEFDFVANQSLISVEYVFGSEEYLEWVGSGYNDVFAFFVTGANPSGPAYSNTNLAVIPSTSTPVAINSVNPFSNSAFFTNNAGGTTIQYDGFTVVLTAQVAVTPGESYHFKFAIADRNDRLWDSGVFIKGESFTSNECIAGTLTFDSTLPNPLCSNDAAFGVVAHSSVGSDYVYIVIDADGNILAFNNDGQFDLSGNAPGNYSVFGFAYTGTITGLEVGENIQAIEVSGDDSCSSLSSPLTVVLEACVSFEIINCADEVRLECDADLDDLDLVGLPSIDIIYGNPDEVSYTYLDDVLSTTGCETVISRTWIITLGNTTETCVQIITLVDTQGPVISGVQEEINIQCIEDLPAPDAATAADACGSASPVTVFTSQTGELISSCCLTTAYGPGADWSIWLPVLNQGCCFNSSNWLFQDCGTLDQYADGTAHIHGTVYNSANPTQQFVVSIWLQAKRDWSAWSALGRNYRDDLGHAQPNKFIDWSYFELVDGFSTLTGAGDLAGDILFLSHAPASKYFGWQAGEAANNRNNNNGLSGSFSYTGTLGGNQVCCQNGDLNVDLSNCQDFNDLECLNSTSFTRFYRSIDGCYNATIVEQTINVNDTTAPTFDNCPENINLSCEQEVPAVAEGITAQDNCVGDVVVAYLGEEIEGNNCYRTITRTWSATDECGNRADCVQVITIVDETAPVLHGLPEEELTVECDAVPAVAEVTVTDNCDLTVTVSFNEEVIEGNCPSNYTIVRTWTSYDNCQNGVSYTQTIHVDDTTGPVFDAYPVYTHVECDELPGDLTATDNCGEAVVTLTYQCYLAGGCLGMYYRIYEAVDECGNVTTAEQYIAILDNTAPEFQNVPADANIECSEVSVGDDGNYFGAGDVYAIDNCGYHFYLDCLLPITYTYNEEVVATDDNCPQSFDIIRTWTATDYCDNTATATQTVHVVDTTAPVLTIPADYTANCHETLIYDEASAEDNCGASTISVEVDTVAGNCPNNYTITRTFVAVDECGNYSAPQTQTITVIDQYAPVFGEDNVYSFTYECNVAIDVIQPVATDNCSDLIEYSYSDTNHWGNSCYSGFTRVWTATDECGNSSKFYQSIYVEDTTAPVISGALELTRPCDDYAGIYVTATDNCNSFVIEIVDEEEVSGSCAGTIMRYYVATDSCGNASPEFIQIIHLTDEVAPWIVSQDENFTVECGTPYEVETPVFADNCDNNLEVVFDESSTTNGCLTFVTYEWTATDHCGLSVTATTVVTIEDNTNPEFHDFPASVTISCEETVPAVVYPTATDNCDEDVTILFAEEVVEGDCPNERVIYRTFRGYDNCGNQVIETQVITITDVIAPTFNESNLHNFTYECDEIVPVVTPTVFDNCSELIELTYNDTNSWTQGCYSGFTRVWTATDECDNSTTFHQYIQIQDTTAPVVQPYAFELEMPCDNISEEVLISAIDNCNEVIITFTDEHVSGACAGKIIRTYHIEDICGNETEGVYQQFITLIDTTAPTVEVAPENVTIECGSDLPVYTPVWSDNCADTLEQSAISSIGFDGCTTIISQAWTAVDPCGNSTTVGRTITIEDNTNPYFTNTPADVNLSCTDTIPAAGASAEDVCDDDVTVTHNDVIVPGSCPANYSIIRTYTATDNCNNSVEYVQTITITDSAAPVFNEGQISQYSYECSETPAAIQPTATDNCSIISYSSNDGPVWNDGCSYGFARTWTATDACGNSSEFVQYLSFHDTTAPVVNPFEIEIEMPCDNISEQVLITASDLCNEVVITFTDEHVSGACAGKIIRTYHVEDICGNETEGVYQQFITLIDVTAPTVEVAPVNVEIECGSDLPVYTPVWSDNCAEDLELSAASSTGFEGCNQWIHQSWTAVDPCGNSTTVSRTITLVDNTDPYFTSTPDDANISCTDTIPSAAASAGDVCDDDVTVTHNDVIVPGSCPANYTIVRTYTATDDCGNEAFYVQNIHVSDYVAPVFGENQTSFTYECGSDVPVVTPSATDNCSTISYNHTDGDIETQGCNSGFVRTWIATDACGNQSQPFNQYIYFEDTTDPILEGCPSDLVLACDAEIPAPAQVTASDVCDSEVTVVYEEFTYGDVPAEGSIADCDLITPVRPANNPCVYPYDWAMVLFDMSAGHKYYSVSEGNLVQYPNGSVHVTATMNNVLNPANGWFVDVWFQGGLDWSAWSSQSFPTSFKADCGAVAANHTEWLYFILQAGPGAELTGFGAYTGSQLNLVHAPANNYFGFQLGDGANNYNAADNGFGGWFSYSGNFNGANITGAGDFAFELDCCPDYWIVRQWTATDCSGNSVSCSQTITFDGSADNNGGGDMTTINVPSDQSIGSVTVAPNPASDNTMFTFKTKEAGKTSLEVYDIAGAKVADVYMGVVEAGVEYRVNYNVNALATGVYMYRLTNGEGAEIGRLIINK